METLVRSCQETFDDRLARSLGSRLTGTAADGRKVLLVAPRGPTRLRLCRELRRRGYRVTRTSPDTDLFLRALGKQAIVYSPVRSMLATQLGDENSQCCGPTEMEEVLRASNAPGVRMIVLVLPTGGDYEPELRALRKSGTPYVVLRAPALFHEMANVALDPSERSLWVPAVGSFDATSSEVLATAVAEALVTERQGREVTVPFRRLDAAQLLQAAAATLDGARPTVHRLWPPLFQSVRPIARWLLLDEPAALEFVDRILGAWPTGGAPAVSRQQGAPPLPGAASYV